MDRSRKLPERRSTRLKGFDYATSAGYVITICTHERRPLFGTIRDGVMHLSALGRIVEEEWQRTGIIRPEVVLDAHSVMPNHFHGIVILNQEHPQQTVRRTRDGLPPAPVRSLGALVRGFKSAVTGRARRELPGIGEPIWQRNYHDHIIRSDRDLEVYRGYVENNVRKWELDRYHEAESVPDPGQ